MFQALSNLGRSFGKLVKYDRAIELHLEAILEFEIALCEKQAQYSDQVFGVMDELAMAGYNRYRYGCALEDDAPKAERLRGVVVERHSNGLGKKHEKSLWASCNLARIRATMRNLEGVEKLHRTGLLVAERTIGAHHIGTLKDKAYMGQVLTMVGKLDEAEDLLCSVVEAHRLPHDQRIHPDHLVAATLLLDCYRRRKRYKMVQVIEKQVL